MQVKFNGYQVLSMQASLSKAGSWRASLVVDGQGDVIKAGSCAILISDEVELVGTAMSSREMAGRYNVSVIAGRNCLHKRAIPKYVVMPNGVPFVALAGSLLSEAGELFGNVLSPELLAVTLPSWMIQADRYSIELTELCNHKLVRANWYFQEDGKAYLAKDNYIRPLSGDFDAIDLGANENGDSVYVCETPNLWPYQPGPNGGQVEQVDIMLDEQRKRMTVTVKEKD